MLSLNLTPNVTAIQTLAPKHDPNGLILTLILLTYNPGHDQNVYDTYNYFNEHRNKLKNPPPFPHRLMLNGVP